MDEFEINMRKLRYRLKRQGMLELDVWLAKLEPALESHHKNLDVALARLVDCEPEKLLEMMQGVQPVPEVLRPWLVTRES